MEREDIIPLPRRARAASGQNAEELRAVAIYFRFRTELPTVGAAGKGGCRLEGCRLRRGVVSDDGRHVARRSSRPKAVSRAVDRCRVHCLAE